MRSPRPTSWLVSSCLAAAVSCAGEPVPGGDTEGATEGGEAEGGASTGSTTTGSSTSSGDTGSGTGSTSSGESTTTGTTTSGTTTTTSTDGGGDETAGTEGGADDPLVALALGTYAVKGVMVGTQTLFPLTFQSQVIAYGVTEIVDEGGTLFADETICRTETLTEGGMVTSEIPDSTVQSTGTIRSPFDVFDDAGQGRWIRGMVPVPVGWIPAAPGDLLPQAADDPRVFDQDMDGHPGVTAHINANLAGIGAIDDDFYLVLLQASEYTGTLAADRRHVGLAEDKGTTQKAIGSMSGLWWNTLNPTNVFGPKENNPVTMVPVEDGTTCDDLIARLGELFPG